MKGSGDIVYEVDGQEIRIECKNRRYVVNGEPYISIEAIAEMLLAKQQWQATRHNTKLPAPGQPLMLRNFTLHYTGDQAQIAATKTRRVTLPPGVRLSAAARAVLTPRAYRRHVLVAVSEMQAEYIEEIDSGNEWKARWVSVRGHTLILWALVRAALPARVRAFLSG